MKYCTHLVAFHQDDIFTFSYLIEHEHPALLVQDSKQYCASLAHKCNHSFLPNSEFVVFDHPKFGLIPCLLSIADIQKDQEVMY
jgi:hypothetical protein